MWFALCANEIPHPPESRPLHRQTEAARPTHPAGAERTGRPTKTTTRRRRARATCPTGPAASAPHVLLGLGRGGGVAAAADGLPRRLVELVLAAVGAAGVD